jgi:hypothetical protein
MLRVGFCLFLLLLPALGAERDLGELKQDLKKSLATADTKLATRTIAGLRALGGEKAVAALTEVAVRFEKRDEEFYWLFVEGIASFGDKPALEAVGNFIVKQAKHPVAQDVLFALERNVISTKCAALIPVLAKAPEALALAAIRQLAKIRVPDAVDALIARLKATTDAQAELRRNLAGALANITGQHFGPSAANWESWWAQNRAKPLTGASHEGRTSTAIDELDATRREQVIGLEKMPKRRIVVIKGKHVDADHFDHNFDHIERLLEQMALPHTVITKEDFEAGFQLSESMVVCINCTMWREHCVCPTCKPGDYTGDRLHQCTGCNKHDPRKYDFSPAACERLKKFVDGGGYLFTEDWVLEELLAKIYPELLGAGAKLRPADVKALPGANAAMHPYLEGVFRHDKDIVLAGEHREKGKTTVRKPEEDARTYFARSNHRWKIDLDSPAVTIRNKSAVTVLLQSPDLAGMARGDTALAVTFKPGKGRRTGAVLHILSHFGKQTSQDSEYGIQNLLLNFLIDANLHIPAPLAKAEGKKEN